MAEIEQERAVVDTTLPFQSVKAAVSMFGEKADTRKFRFPEKHGNKEAELHCLKEELADVKVQLTDAEKAKAKAFTELRDAKRQLEEVTRQLEETCLLNHRESPDSLARPDAGGLKQRSPNADKLKQSSSPSAEEKHVVWEVELKVAQQQHMTAVAELENAKKELERLRQELSATLHEKECAIHQAEEALAAAEMNAKRVEELSHEISGTNESLVLVKLACIEASKERAALLAAKNADRTSDLSGQDLAAIQELELKLAAATEELHSLHQELVVAKEEEGRMAKALSEAFANLQQAKSEVTDLQKQANIAKTSSEAATRELEVAKRDLEKALKSGASLHATMVTLQAELDTMRKELEELREREANANATVVSLTSELAKTKAELCAAFAAETKANEAILGLSQTLQQIKAEAEDAKESAKILEEEANKARAEAEQARAAMNAADHELQAAMKVAEAAKAAENAALAKFRALNEKVNAVRASEVDGGSAITISQDEYDSLKRKVHEAEELANMRVVAASAQVEAVKAGELEMQQRLESLNEDIDAMKAATKQALQRAEMAEAAKSAVESEMRRWRLKETQRREREAAMAVQKDFLNMGANVNSRPLSVTRAPQTESLAQILNMKLPHLDKENKGTQHTLVQKKKKHILPSLTTFLSKKNPPNTGMLET